MKVRIRSVRNSCTILAIRCRFPFPISRQSSLVPDEPEENKSHRDIVFSFSSARRDADLRGPWYTRFVTYVQILRCRTCEYSRSVAQGQGVHRMYVKSLVEIKKHKDLLQFE